MTRERIPFVVLGVLIWLAGLTLLAYGAPYWARGATVLAGGLVLVIVAAGGWGRFAEGVANWLFFWR